MKRTITLFITLVALVSVLWVGVSRAANVRSGDAPTIMSTETINGTLYVSGATIKIDGTVDGDVLCLGQSLTISGTVKGDVLCAAQMVTITGHVEGDVRVAGQTASVGGTIDGSLSVAAMQTTLDKNAVIGRDISIVGDEAQVAGKVTRDLTSIVTTFKAEATIGRDLDVTGTTITLGSGTMIGGDFRSVSAREATRADGVTIVGKTDHRQPPSEANSVLPPAAYVTATLFALASFMILGLALLMGVPKFMPAVAAQLKRAPFGSLGVGIIGLIMTPIVAICLIISIVAMPLGLVLLFAWLIALICGLVLSAYRLGEVIVAKMGWSERWQQMSSLAIGLLALFVVAMVPYLGDMVILAAIVWGIGGCWYAFVQARGSKQQVVTKGAA